jgi:hypothetical protein
LLLNVNVLQQDVAVLTFLPLSSLLPSACHHAPLTSLHGRAAYPIPPLSHPHVFGWLLRKKISNSGHLRPFLYFVFANFFVVRFAAPKYEKTPPQYTPPWPRILSIIPPFAAADYWLIVVSYHPTAAT